MNFHSFPHDRLQTDERILLTLVYSYSDDMWRFCLKLLFYFCKHLDRWEYIFKAKCSIKMD